MHLKKYKQGIITCSLIFLWLNSELLFAQNPSKDVSHTDQEWLHYFFQAKVSEKWSLLADGSYRWRTCFESRASFLVRVGVAYQLNPSVRFAFGLATLGTFGEENITRREYRPHQEITIRNKLPHLDITHRFRLEERFFKETHPTDGKNPNSFNYRIRYQFLMNIPLLSFSKTKPEKKLNLSIGNEIFINAGAQVTYNLFDQNRLFTSPSLQLNKHVNIALTYAYQFASLNTPNKYIHTDIYWFIIRHNIDLSSKNKKS